MCLVVKEKGCIKDFCSTDGQDPIKISQHIIYLTLSKDVYLVHCRLFSRKDVIQMDDRFAGWILCLLFYHMSFFYLFELAYYS